MNCSTMEREWNSRLDRYLELGPKEIECNYFDPIIHLTRFEDTIKSSSNDICVCERNRVCQCKGECCCDSDEFIIVKDITNCGITSGCHYLITLFVNHKFNNKKNLRIFCLDKKTDEEIPLFDIKAEKMSKRKFRYSQITFLQTPMNYHIDHAKIDEQYIEIKFNYMWGE